MRFDLKVLLVAPLFLAACSTTDSGAKDSEDGTTPACETTIKGTYPADGAMDAYYRTTIEFELSEADTTAVVTAPFAGTQSTSEDGKTVIFTPTDALSASTSYDVTLDYCGGTATISFTTSALGGPVEASSLLGRTYLLDLSSATITEPPNVGDILKNYLTVGILTGVTEASQTSLTMLGALENGDTTGNDQDYCTPTIPFPAADFSGNPYFEIAGDSVVISVSDYDVELRNLKIGGTFAADGSYYGGATLEGTVDTRAFDSLAGGETGAVCDLVSSFGVECEACAGDGEPYCLSIKARDIVANEVGGLEVVQIDGSDCAGCTAGVPADTSDTCPQEGA